MPSQVSSTQDSEHATTHLFTIFFNLIIMSCLQNYCTPTIAPLTGGVKLRRMEDSSLCLPMILPYNFNRRCCFSRIRTKRATLALWVALMFLVAFLVVSFHHHADGEEHSDCPVCAVKYHHSSGATFSVVVLSVPTSFFPALFLFISLLAQPSGYVSPAYGRAPPVLHHA